jgi:hypothetical protein
MLILYFTVLRIVVLARYQDSKIKENEMGSALHRLRHRWEGNTEINVEELVC